MESTIYDITIIGAGAAGLQLCMGLLSDPYFQNQKILVIDKDEKAQNDRTWCYWERGDGKWDPITHHQWSEGYFYSSRFEKLMTLSPYRYKMLKAIDFYDFTKKAIQNSSNVHWEKDDVKSLQKGENVEIKGTEKTYFSKLVFDSRIHPDFFKKNDHYIRLLQHFKGWVVRTKEDFFDPSKFVMMDFRLKWKKSTSFTYVLPTSTREALVEYTLFSDALIEDGDYEKMLTEYFSKYLKLQDFEIIETEKGVIPMSNFPFDKYNDQNIIKIGTAGAWVKPSSGYSFKNCGKYSEHIIQNIKSGKSPTHQLISKKHRIYDTIFLDVLFRKNELGEELFTYMYQKNGVRKIFRFLDEETTFAEDLSIMYSFRSGPFLASLLSQLKANLHGATNTMPGL